MAGASQIRREFDRRSPSDGYRVRGVQPVRLALALAAALLAPVTAAHAQDMTKDTTFDGGPLDKIVMGPVVFVSDGKTHFGLKPSLPNASPVPVALEKQVAGLLKAYDASDDAASRSFFSATATGEICPKGMGGDCEPVGILFSEQFAEHCDHNTPFYMGNDQVRIEWLYKGQLYYISYLNFTDGKIARVRTLVAEVPPMMRPQDAVSVTDKTNG